MSILNTNILEFYKQEINNFLKNNLKLELHQEKSKIFPLRNGITLLGYRIFTNYKLLIKRNIISFKKRFQEKLNLYENDLLDYDDFINSFQGWLGYAKWANNYSFKKKMLKSIEEIFLREISMKEINNAIK